MIEKGPELDERLHRRCRSRPVLIEHLPLGRRVASKQRSDKQAVMLIEFLQGEVGRAVQFDQSLLAATAEQ